MAGVFCPTCESVVSASAAYCLACGHDLTVQGPITSTGHDLNQLKEVVRLRDDLSMADKFDLIAKVEEGANPILLGIAAPAEAPAEGEAEAEGGETAAQVHALEPPIGGWGQSSAVRAAAEAVSRSSRAMSMVESGTIDRDSEPFRAAMDRGFEAGRHLHAVACGAHEGADPEAMQDVTQLTPPQRSFCPKCGSDINSFTVHQWTKWQGTADGVLLLELEAAMEAALVELAAHYEDRLDEAASKGPEVDVDALRAEIEAEVRAELKADASVAASEAEEDSSDAGDVEEAKATRDELARMVRQRDERQRQVVQLEREAVVSQDEREKLNDDLAGVQAERVLGASGPGPERTNGRAANLPVPVPTRRGQASARAWIAARR